MSVGFSPAEMAGASCAKESTPGLHSTGKIEASIRSAAGKSRCPREAVKVPISMWFGHRMQAASHSLGSPISLGCVKKS